MSCRDFENLPRFDQQEALERCMDSLDFLQELADVFVSESLPMYLPRIQEGVDNRDFDKVAGNAHGLKGGCSSIGLTRLREMSYCLEKAGKDKDLQTMERVLAELTQEAQKVEQLITSRELWR